MIAGILGMSDERLCKTLANWLYGREDVPVELNDVLAFTVMLWREVLLLRGRFNMYDGKGAGALLSIKDVMNMTGLSRSSVYRKMRRCTFKSVKADGRRYIFRTSLEYWLRQSEEHKSHLPWYQPAPKAPPQPEDASEALSAALNEVPPFSARL